MPVATTATGAETGPLAVSAHHCAVAPQARHLRAKSGLDMKAGRVTFEIFHHLLARWIKRIGLRHGYAGQAGVIAIGVQVQTIVVPSPGRADIIGLLEHRDVETRNAHRCGTGQPRRAGTDDDRVEFPQ